MSASDTEQKDRLRARRGNSNTRSQPEGALSVCVQMGVGLC